MTIDAPFVSSVMTVQPEWIDYNGHMNMAYYSVLFDRGVDQAFELLGFDRDYIAKKQTSFFTLEAHVTYLREIGEGDSVTIAFQLLDYDAKRTHFFQQMTHASDGFIAATAEQMSIHVDMNSRRSAPFPDAILARIAALHKAHANLPRPPQAGHVIGIPRKSASA